MDLREVGEGRERVLVAQGDEDEAVVGIRAQGRDERALLPATRGRGRHELADVLAGKGTGRPQLAGGVPESLGARR